VGSYSISAGGAQCQHFTAGGGASISVSSNVHITLNGVPTFEAFAVATSGGNWGTQPGFLTFSGTCTGQKYYCNFNGVVNSESSDPNFFPGSLAGSTSSGGQYD
jgi:hypothetical protein